MAEIRVTQTGVYAEEDGAVVRITQTGAYAEQDGAVVRITQAGVYAELDAFELRTTQAGVYAEFTAEPPDTTVQYGEYDITDWAYSMQLIAAMSQFDATSFASTAKEQGMSLAKWRLPLRLWWDSELDSRTMPDVVTTPSTGRNMRVQFYDGRRIVTYTWIGAASIVEANVGGVVDGAIDMALELVLSGAPERTVNGINVIRPLTEVSDTTANNSNISALGLWNGSSNDNPPDGWRELGFDDSGWDPAMEVTHPDITPLSDTKFIAAEAYDGISNPSDDDEENLIRHVFTLSAGTVSNARLTIRIEDILHGVWINDNFLGEALTDPGAAEQNNLNIEVSPTILNEGNNILACHFANATGSVMAVSYKLEVS